MIIVQLRLTVALSVSAPPVAIHHRRGAFVCGVMRFRSRGVRLFRGWKGRGVFVAGVEGLWSVDAAASGGLP